MGGITGPLLSRYKRLAVICLVVFLAGCGIPQFEVSPLPVPPSPVNKKGIGATSAGCLNYTCEDLQTLDLSWAFTWGGGVRDCDGIEKVFMINWDKTLDGRDLSQYSKWLMTFNEPDEQYGNGETHPTYAAYLWRRIEQYYPDKRLISPAILRTHTPNCYWGMTCRWLDDWHSEYIRLYGEPPRIDAMGGHCYGITEPDLQLLTACRKMVGYLEDRAEQWGVTGGLWLNEFGPVPNPNQDEMNRQLFETLAYLERTPSVKRYAVWTLRLADWQSMNTLECNGVNPTEYGDIYRTQFQTTYLPRVGR